MDDGQSQSAASKLVQLASELYTFGMASDGEPFALPQSGPRVARLFRGSGYSLRAALARAYHDRHGKPPGNGALADALEVLIGKAQAEEPIELPLRATWNEGSLVIDMGDQTGRAIIITPDGWEVVDDSPVLFRRTRLTAALPEPERGGKLTDNLFAYTNLAKEDWAVAAACLVMSWWPDAPRPVLLFTGPEGVIKTSTTKRFRDLVDPSPVPTRGAPEEKDWVVTASSQWVVALDNLSSIPDWLSDAVCRASTGEGWTARKLYTDNDITAVYALRTVMMNGVDLHEQVTRSDFADRLVTFHLQPVRYRAQKEIEAEWQAAFPRALGALLDLTSKVLAALPAIEASGRHRMADFERVLRATDKAMGTHALHRYENQSEQAAEDTLNGTPAAMAVLRFGRTLTESWTGYADDLAKATGTRLSSRDMQSVGQLTGMLRRAGVSVKRDHRRGKRGYKWTIAPM